MGGRLEGKVGESNIKEPRGVEVVDLETGDEEDFQIGDTNLLDEGVEERGSGGENDGGGTDAIETGDMAGGEGSGEKYGEVDAR